MMDVALGILAIPLLLLIMVGAASLFLNFE